MTATLRERAEHAAKYGSNLMVPARDVQQLLNQVDHAEAHIATMSAFINQRPEYVTALRNTPGDADQSDYHRWQGGAEARRQLAQSLGWTVPHEPGEVARRAES